MSSTVKVRAFPKPVHPPERRGQGWCQWCGESILKGGRGIELDLKRTWHRGRDGEPDCLHEYELHVRPDVQKAHLIERDGDKCAECGGNPVILRHDHTLTMRGRSRADINRDDGRRIDQHDPRIEYVGPFWSIWEVRGLEVEHVMPLWLTVHLTDDERRPYFGPTNLQLLCVGCHKAKTARESADRAKGNRLKREGKPGGRMRSQVGRGWPSRPIPSRPFTKRPT